MRNKNRKNDIENNYMIFTRTSEKYIMLSTCLSRDNIRKILFKSISYNRDVFNDSINSLNNWLGSINSYKVTNVEEYRQILTDYNSQFFNYPNTYIDDFINFASSDLLNKIVELSYIASGKGRKSVPLNNAEIPNRNLIFTFNSKVFLQHISDESEIPYYANAFWNFLMLILLTQYVNNYTDKDIALNLSIFYKYINFNILTGLRLSAEFGTEVLYEELFEEIAQFVPSNKYNMTKTVNEDKQAILFRIKNNFMLRNTFKFYGWYKGVKNEFDKILDKKSEAELRIKRGTKPNTIEFSLYITGMRTISRVLSRNCNPNGKVYLHNFWEKGGMFVSLIINLYLRTIIINCNLSINKSYYTTYAKFIDNYEGERNTALKSAVAVLLSELPENKRKRLIDKHFKKEDYRQKTNLNKDIRKIIKHKEIDNKCSSARFCNALGRYYVW
ncbi:MAG: hypothetical protein NC200_08265 [Candidatus Gastranaerophilales bacterium]|nr:hypothetical protein [Candidatus Gastranaerophilales bacterium]